MSKGTIFNIQRFSLHDGPGIRTTVFLKGCPLNCKWCHNPESQSVNQQLSIWPEGCISCGECQKVCPSKAKCILCGKCAERCPANARELIGKEVTLSYVMKEILKDRIFFDESGGGVTFSGGEPLMQPDFLQELLMECKKEHISAVVDTCGFAPWEVLAEISRYTDFFLYDLKHMDDIKHQKYTGVSNEIILGNLEKLSFQHKGIIVRIPLIPGINDSREEIKKIGEYLAPLKIKRVNVLPYHDIARDKYSRLKKEYELAHLKAPQEEKVTAVIEILRKSGLSVTKGG